jgi:hypothetical protein
VAPHVLERELAPRARPHQADARRAERDAQRLDVLDDLARVEPRRVHARGAERVRAPARVPAQERDQPVVVHLGRERDGLVPGHATRGRDRPAPRRSSVITSPSSRSARNTAARGPRAAAIPEPLPPDRYTTGAGVAAPRAAEAHDRERDRPAPGAQPVLRDDERRRVDRHLRAVARGERRGAERERLRGRTGRGARKEGGGGQRGDVPPARRESAGGA